MKFTVTSGFVALTSAANDAGDVYLSSLRYENAAGQRIRAVTTGGAYVANGLTFDNTGRLLYVDATAGLPAGTVTCNGLPISAGALCTSTDASATVQNGIPFAPNGAVSVTVTA